MGRIKGTLIKRATKDVMGAHSGRFSNDFEENKKAVSHSIPGITKKLRNSMAGYISRLNKKLKKQKK